jgi:hypothetical protein
MIKHIAIVALIAACGGRQVPSSNSTAPLLGIADMKFYEEDHLVAHLGPDGTFEIDRDGHLAAVGSITGDGKLTGRDGKAAQLQADGTIVAVGRTTDDLARIRLVGDTLFVEREKGPQYRATIDEKGMVLLDGKSLGKPMRVEGASDANTRRTALLVVGLMGISGREVKRETNVSVGAEQLVQHIGAFFIKVADAMDASGGDCDKLADNVQALVADAKALRRELVDAHKKLDDMKDPPPGVAERFGALHDPAAVAKCWKNARVKKAFDETLSVIAPLEENSEFVNAFADALGKAAAH